MATMTGKAARKRHGTRAAAKRAKVKNRTARRRELYGKTAWGRLLVCESQGNAKDWREGRRP